MAMKKYHCCATCKHFVVEKSSQGMNYRCGRLGFETKTTYQFDCWSPKEQVRKLMSQAGESDNEYR